MSGNARRDALTDTAITVLARAGGRGLTHRAVDRAAEVPEGSTSYYFRTRESLLRAVVERLATLDTAALPALSEHGRHGLVTALAGAVEDVLTTGRDRLLARYELSLEATRRPELRDVLYANATSVRNAMADQLNAAGSADPQRSAEELLALLDGLLFDQVTELGARQLDGVELRAWMDRMLKAVGV